MGEARAHRPVASADCLARGVGHGAVEAAAIEVRAGRFGWPAIKKAGGKKTARESSYFHFAGCNMCDIYILYNIIYVIYIYYNIYIYINFI